MAEADVSNLRLYRANMTFRDLVKDHVYEIDPSAWAEYIEAEMLTAVDSEKDAPTEIDIAGREVQSEVTAPEAPADVHVESQTVPGA